MQIFVTLDDNSRTARPGSTVQGSVRLRSPERVTISEAEIRVVSKAHKGRSVHLRGILTRKLTIQGDMDLPLAITFPDYKPDMAKVNWQVEVEARYGDDKTATGSTSIVAMATSTQKAGEYFGRTVIALVMIGAGLLGLNMGIVGVKAKIIPEGVRWFAFIMGMLAMFAASAVTGERTDDGRKLWSSLPGAALVGAVGVLCLYMFIIQPDFYPYGVFIDGTDSFRMYGLQGLTDWALTEDVSQRLMLLIAAGSLIPIAVSLVAFRKTKTALIADMALTTITVVPAVVFAASFMIPDAPINHILALFGIGGVVSGYYALRSGRWTAAAIGTVLAAASVPTIIGIASLVGARRSTHTNAEYVMGAGALAWGLIVAYLGARNVLVSMLAGNVKVNVVPNPVTLGGVLSIDVAFFPHTRTEFHKVTALLSCTQLSTHYVGSDRRTDITTIYRDLRNLDVNETVESGGVSRQKLMIPIPVGQHRTDTSSTNGFSWELEVRVELKGKPDWAATYPITVS